MMSLIIIYAQLFVIVLSNRIRNPIALSIRIFNPIIANKKLNGLKILMLMTGG